MSRSDAVVVLSTIDDEQEAKRLAKSLVKAKLAACVNIVPQITSIYEWKKEICEEAELLLVIKSQQSRLKELKALFEELHPYEVPEFLVLNVTDGLPDYLKWLLENTK